MKSSSNQELLSIKLDTAKGQIPYEIAGEFLSATGSALSTYAVIMDMETLKELLQANVWLSKVELRRGHVMAYSPIFLRSGYWT